MATGNLFDDYLQQLQVGWTPNDPGGSGPGVVTTSGNAAWQAAQSGNQPQPSQPQSPYRDIQPAQDMNKNRSFFPASPGQIIQPSGSGNAGYGPGQGSLPPDQNPAYQATISKPRMQRGDLTTYQLPSGGFASVKSGSRVPNYNYGSIQIGNQFPVNRATEFAKGYGAANPTIENGYQVAGGVANPVENLTPQQRIAGGAGGGLDYFRSNPALSAATNFGLNNLKTVGNYLSGFGQNVANFFTGGNANAQNPSPTPNSTAYPAPLPTPKPRRYFDF